MAQTVIGIFKNSAEAQNARQHLMDNGFTDECIDISRQSEANYDEHYSGKDPGVGEQIQNFFRNLFSDEEDIARYTTAASRGTVVTVHALTRVEAVAAVGIMDDYGAVDVDEYAASNPGIISSSSGSGPGLKEVDPMSVTDNTFDSGRVSPASTGSGLGDAEAAMDRPQSNDVHASSETHNTYVSMDPDQMTGADRRENTGAYTGPDSDFKNRNADRDRPSGMGTGDDQRSRSTDTGTNPGLREMRADEKRSRSRIVERQVEETSRLREERMRADDANGFKDVDEKQQAVRESLKSTEVNREDLTASGDRKDSEDDVRHVHGEDIHRQRPGII